MVLSFYYSFTHYDLLNPPHWVGLDNYRFMFGLGTIDGRQQADPYYWQSVKNTLWIIAIAVPLRIVFALGTAMLLTRPKRGVNVYRTLFFMPSLAPTVGSALVFVYLLNPTTGPVNQVLEQIPGISAPLWFYDPTWAKPALVVLGLWGIGDAIVIYLAGLLDVPRDLYEAISIEGANAWQRFRYVTLPMMTPVIFFTLVIGVIDGFQYFDQAYVSASTAGSGPGDPQGSLLFYGVWLYQQAFSYFHMGYASAMAWVLFLATMAFTAGLLRDVEALGALPRRSVVATVAIDPAPPGSTSAAVGFLMSVANHAVLIAVSLAFALPVVFMVLTAVMTDQQALTARLVPAPRAALELQRRVQQHQPRPVHVEHVPLRGALDGRRRDLVHPGRLRVLAHRLARPERRLPARALDARCCPRRSRR